MWTTVRVLLAAVILTVLASGTARASGPDPAGAQEYEASIDRLDKATKQRMRGSSMHPGCPVKFRDLRYVTLRHHTFTGGTRMGELVVHERWADEIVEVFGVLYDKEFPIRKMNLVDDYGGNDTRSMKHDNTSAFNCRWRAGSPGVWSQHAYGRAIDINPVENPYFVPPDHVSPPKGERFLDRTKKREGMILRKNGPVQAFRDIGWEWGGFWNTIKDWQHFSANGK